MNQYRHPHETKHSMDEMLSWFDKYGVDFVNATRTLTGVVSVLTSNYSRRTAQGRF